MKERILETWQSYRKEVIHPAAPPEQVEECRRAFYAGAGGMFAVLIRDLTDGDECAEADLRMMDELREELHAHFLQVTGGRA